MRIFEFDEDEHVHDSNEDGFTHATPIAILDLDSIVMLELTTLKYAERITSWWKVILFSGHELRVTETAFARVRLAWQSS